MVPIETVAEYCGADEEDANLILIHEAVESWISSACGRNLESQSYEEKRDGTGTKYLTLYQYPVTAITEIKVNDGDNIEDYEIYSDGTICLKTAIFSTGCLNVVVKYTAGYTVVSCPGDLKGAILFMCKKLWQTREEDTEGLKSFSLGDISKAFEVEYPFLLASVVGKYGVHPV